MCLVRACGTNWDDNFLPDMIEREHELIHRDMDGDRWVYMYIYKDDFAKNFVETVGHTHIHIYIHTGFTMATLYAVDQRPLAVRSLALLPPPLPALHKCIALDNGPQGKQVLLPAPELNLAQLTDVESDLKRQLDRWAFGHVAGETIASTGKTCHVSKYTHVPRMSPFSCSSLSLVSSPGLGPGAALGSVSGSVSGSAPGSRSVSVTGLDSGLDIGSVPVPASASGPDFNSSTTSKLTGQRTKPSIERRRKYVCKTCQKGFTTSGHLARHKRIHTGEKNHVCPHEGCGQRFSRHDNCVQHYKTHLRG
ncbi:LAME_0H13916g1_1 [Lachancea meyersii CBS 8951]|uniref:LAME_0H13916g1_1 n=1 Tax=Lachancea meyersii CBS 8951 TaxID=1266667 RepID=A0A1G4KH81_9SACH|nr:LAME_0H13916g1_1 [Lachancea meyersii CBS 8951]